jgi:hypothetical protein
MAGDVFAPLARPEKRRSTPSRAPSVPRIADWCRVDLLDEAR